MGRQGGAGPARRAAEEQCRHAQHVPALRSARCQPEEGLNAGSAPRTAYTGRSPLDPQLAGGREAGFSCTHLAGIKVCTSMTQQSPAPSRIITNRHGSTGKPAAPRREVSRALFQTPREQIVCPPAAFHLDRFTAAKHKADRVLTSLSPLLAPPARGSRTLRRTLQQQYLRDTTAGGGTSRPFPSR